MVAKQGNKPVWQKNDGSVQVSIFKNKNVRGSVYPVICVQARRYPLKFTRKIYLKVTEAEKIAEILSNLPKIELKEKKKKK